MRPVPPSGHPVDRRREPLWDRVDRNRFALAGYVAAFVALSTASFAMLALPAIYAGLFAVALTIRANMLGYLLIAHAPQVWLYSSAGLALISLGWALYAVSRCERWTLRQLGAELVPHGELLPTKMALKDMAIAAGHPVAPALHIIDTTSVNACVISAHRRRAAIVVTRGLVERLTVAEQRAVFANLISRLSAGDTIVITGVTAMLWPMYAYKSRSGDPDARSRSTEETVATAEGMPFLFLWYVLFGFAFGLMAYMISSAHRKKQLRVAEKADAEGMLLLKDPQSMLSALEKSVSFNNLVGAGEAFTSLFYCHAGMSTNDEEDPEWRRVARLREVLGVEGVVASVAPTDSSEMLVAPPPPRLEGTA